MFKFLIYSWICFLLVFISQVFAEGKIAFWDKQRRGANFFNRDESSERFQAAKEFGIQFIRLAPNKWMNGRPDKEAGDFLIGRPGTFKSINSSDLKVLRERLDEANRAGLKVLLTLLSLPGGRWKQHNHQVEERKIWQDFSEQENALSFWRQLAQALKGHPALIGYNVRNEPSPELAEPKLNDWYTGNYEGWYKKIRGTPSDLNLFYGKVVRVIREVDADIPIVLDTGFYATAWGFKVLEPVSDHQVIYSFHMYEPYSFNSQFNQGKYQYPGEIPIGELPSAPTLSWNKERLKKFLSPVTEWQKRYGMSSNRILVGEVGVYRTHPGARAYLKDVLEIINSYQWHWAFYSFREDTWAGMDYELGSGKAGKKYWDAIENNRVPGKEVYKSNPLSQLLKAAIRGELLP